MSKRKQRTYKKEQTLYLSELFLNKLNGEFSCNAVTHALESCNNEILYRIQRCPYIKKTSKSQELLDFWDVYKEFDDMLNANIKENYFILQMVS